MSDILSIRIDSETKDRLDRLAKQCHRSKSYLAAEAIASFLRAEEWQLSEIQAGIDDLESGEGVGHADVADWLKSWGRSEEGKPPDRKKLRASTAKAVEVKRARKVRVSRSKTAGISPRKRS